MRLGLSERFGLSGRLRASPHDPVGMRRVDWVRIVLGDDAVSCRAVGVGHRLPMERPITLSMAMGLAADGVAVVVRRDPAVNGRGHGVGVRALAGSVEELDHSV